MTTCIKCTHWKPKDGTKEMAVMGFAPCEKKSLPGHTVSANAPACHKFAALPADKVQARKSWLAKKESK